MDQRPPIPAPDAALFAAVSAHVAATKARVSPMTYQGQTIWVKQRENLSLKMRLQKGSATAAFQAERAALRQLQAADVPVPAILAEGPDWFATADSGPSLKHLLYWQEGSLDSRKKTFAAAGHALAAMHAQHLSHGRPSIKDICWLDGRITFLDFERFHTKRNTPKGHAQDLVMFVFSAFVMTHGKSPEIDAAIEAYRANDPAHIWETAQAWCRKMRWLDFATKPVQWFDNGKNREFRAIPLTFAAFATG